MKISRLIYTKIYGQKEKKIKALKNEFVVYVNLKSVKRGQADFNHFLLLKINLFLKKVISILCL